MEYEVAEYIKQLREIRKNFQRKEGTSEEFLSKMSSDDKLNPVVVIMFYHGTGEYEGSKDLHSMLDFAGENAIYKEFVTNYQMNLITLDDIKEENFIMQRFFYIKRRYNIQTQGKIFYFKEKS